MKSEKNKIRTCRTCGKDKKVKFFPIKDPTLRPKQKPIRWQRCKRCWAAYYRNYRIKNPCRSLWLSARRRALAKGIEFTIKLTDLKMPKRCPIFGIRLKVGADKKYGPTGPSECSPSLDRFDVRYGYVPGNVTIISQKANRVKNNGTLAEHRAIVRWMKSVIAFGDTPRERAASSRRL